MNFIKKYWISIVSLMLAAVTGLSCIINGIPLKTEAVETKIRTVSVTEKYAEDLSVFSSYTITEDEVKPSFTGVTAYNSDDTTFFDNVSVDETDGYTVQYDCSFDMEAFQYTLTATLLDQDGAVIETETLVTDAFVTETGGIDAYIELEGERYLMSDFCTENGIDSCGLFKWIVIVVVVLVVVAEVAELVRAKQNYTYNKKLEANGNGVKKGNYITRQNESARSGYKSKNYRFGFTTFGKVGCEVASAYNAMIALGKAEMLSETIYCFEKWLIEFAIGWGHLGSNPLHIGRYLANKGIGYQSYTDYAKFKAAVEAKGSCHVIMSRQEHNPLLNGLHTFYVHKIQKDSYNSYNWNYSDDAIDVKNIDALNDGSGFIVGYIVWKK